MGIKVCETNIFGGGSKKRQHPGDRRKRSRTRLHHEVTIISQKQAEVLAHSSLGNPGTAPGPGDVTLDVRFL